MDTETRPNPHKAEINGTPERGSLPKEQESRGLGPYILIVDDDPDILDNILTILGTQPYRLATARDGKKCMELIAQETPDLLILDLLMPRMDGWGVIREMRSEPRYSAVPIMILTTVIEDASRRRYELETGMAMDVQDYVMKPARPAELLRLVEKHLSRQAIGKSG